MRNARPKYMCFPSVLCVGKETTVTIVPRDTSRVFRPEKEYSIAVEGLLDDQFDYQVKDPLEYPFEIKDGCLRFTYTPTREQELFVRLQVGEKIMKIPFYAVREDLYRLRPLKGDFHAHSYYSDGSDGISMVPADYREEGFDFFTLTDHNRMFTSRLAAELYKDVRLGIHMIPGEEVHTPGSTLHIVHAGGSHSVCEQYIHDPETYERQVEAIVKTLTHIPEQYRLRTAKAHWACEKIHEAGGLAIFAHPRWQPDHYNLSEEFTELLFDERIFDALELIGGCRDRDSNLQLALWQEQGFRGNLMHVVGSSDSHNHDFTTASFGHRFTVVFAEENSTDAILDAVRSGFSVAGELPPDSDSDVRFYAAQARLVSFCHFLFEHYFTETRRLCYGEGVLMRRYAQGEAVGGVLATLAYTVEDFYKQFYGLLPAPVVSADHQAFLDRALHMQRTLGPVTKGSKIFIYGANGRRE